MIHRDIKPSTILLAQRDGGLPKLSDFGIAHALDHRDDAQGITESSTGTPGYMSLEQLWGRWRGVAFVS